MSLSSQTYSDLFAEVEALCGKSFTDVEARRVNRLLNLAARRAYRESVWWERYLVVSQPRTVSRGEIEFSEDSYQVYGAGTSEVNGLYVRNGDQNGFPAYTKYDSSGDAEYSVFVETPLALNTWTIQAGSPSSPTGNSALSRTLRSPPTTAGCSLLSREWGYSSSIRWASRRRC